MSKTLLFHIVYAVEVRDVLTGIDEPLERLREYGAAEVVDVQVVDQPLGKISLDGIGVNAIEKALKSDASTKASTNRRSK